MASTVLCLCFANGAAAQSDAEAAISSDTAPALRGGALPPLPHYVLAWSAGVPLRLATDKKLGQSTLAPAYTDLMGGYIFPGTGRIRHGVGLGLSLNLSEDGGYTEPVWMYEQFVVMPSYLMMIDLAPQLFALAHAGLPINLHAGTTVGIEAAFAFGYRFLAGFGAFAEAGLDTFIGTGSTWHPLLSIEGGVFLDYEVLP